MSQAELFQDFVDVDSIAVIGASSDRTKLRGRLVPNLIAGGFAGDIYPVTRSEDEVFGLRAYNSFESLPQAVDMALVAVPAEHLPGVLDQAVGGAARSLVLFSGGADLAAHKAKLSHEKIRVLGPNTEGFYLPDRKLAATFAPAIAPLLEQGFPPQQKGRRLFIVSQSGGLGFALFTWGIEHFLNFRGIITTGNEADVECLDIVDALLDEEEDPPVIVLVIEGWKAPHRLAEVARKAALANVPIIVLKTGSSQAGARAVESHTAHMAGGDAANDAMFEHYGIIRVFDREQLMAACAALSTAPIVSTRRAAVVTTSGGAGVWATDLCADEGIDVPQLSKELQQTIQPIVPAFGSTANPVDVTAHGAEGAGEGLYGVAEAILASDEVDSIIINQGLPKAKNLSDSRELITRLSDLEVAKPILFHSHIQPSNENRAELARHGLHAFPSLRGCAFALACLTRYADFQSLGPPEVSEPTHSTLSEYPDGPLGIRECEDLLANYGVPAPPSRFAKTEAQAEAAARSLGTAVALKIVSDDIQHKTETGGIMLNVAPEDVAKGFRELTERVRLAVPLARIEGVQIQSMAAPGFELALGVIRDPGFGPLVMLASGGIYIEILGDSVLAPPPITTDIAMRMIRRLRSFPILSGARGGGALDVEALAELLVRVGRLASAEAEHLDQLDLNPVRVYEAGQGVSALDTLAVIGKNGPANAKR